MIECGMTEAKQQSTRDQLEILGESARTGVQELRERMELKLCDFMELAAVPPCPPDKMSIPRASWPPLYERLREKFEDIQVVVYQMNDLLNRIG